MTTPYVLEWIKQHPTFNTIVAETIPGIALDAAGNIYGCYSATATSVGSGGATKSTADIFVFKMNASGEVQWVKNDASFNTSVADTTPSIAVDTSGNVIVSYQTASFGVVSGGTNAGSLDNVVFKLNGTNGSIMWTKQDNTISTGLGDSASQIITDLSNNIYLVFQSTSAVSGATHSGNGDIILVKLNGSNGQRLWVKQDNTFNTALNDTIPTIGLDVSGNPIVAFQTLGAIASSGETATQLGSDNIAVVKFSSSNGARIWGVQKNIFNTSANDQIASIAIDSNGNTFVAYQVSAGGAVSGGVTTGSTDIVIFKLDASGETVWTKQDATINTTGGDITVSITVDASGNPYIGYQASSGAIVGGVAVGSIDVILIKLDGSNGTRLWGKQHSGFNTSSGDFAIKIKADSSNSVFLTYMTGGIVTGGTKTGIANDVVVAKFGPYNTSTAPTTPVISAIQYDTSLIISWSNAELNSLIRDDIYIAYYRIYDAANNLVRELGPYTSSSNFPATTTLTGTPGASYSYYMKVVHNYGVESASSNTVSGIILSSANEMYVLDWVNQQQTFNTVAGELAPAIALDTAGNIYGCYSTAATTFGLGGTSQSHSDIFVFKMNASGVVQWIKNDTFFNTTAPDTLPSIAVDTSGNVCIAYLAGPGAGNATAPGATVSGGTYLGGGDVVVFKLNGTDGSVMWVKEDNQINTPTSESAPQIITDSSNNIYIGYNTLSTVSGGTAVSNSDIVLVKLNSEGVRQWVKQDSTINTSSADSNVTIGIDTNGNIYMAWQNLSALPISGESNTQLGNSNIAVVKFNSSTGDRIWGKQRNIFNTIAGDILPSIAIDSNGNTYVAYQAGAGGVVSGGVTTGSTDIVIFKLDASGETVWTKQDTTINTNQNDTSVSITVDASGNPYIGYQTLTGGAVLGSTAVGSGDVVLVKLDGSTGTRAWAKQHSGFNTSSGETAIKIKVDSSNSVFLTYITSGTVTGGTKTGTANDVVVAKFKSYSIEPPQSLSIVPGTGEVTLNWSTPTLNMNDPSVYVTYYRIYDAADTLVSSLGPYTYNDQLSLPTTLTLSSLLNSQSYSYYMKTENNYALLSEKTTTVTTTTNPVAPGKPTISLTAGNAKLTVSITSLDNGGSSLTGYKYTVNGGAEQSVTPYASSFEIAELSNGTSYSIVVKGVNAVGTGVASDPSSATPVAPNNGGGGGNVPCIVEGQRILTQRGYVKVETLESTDYIITSDGRQVAANVYKFTVDNTTEKTAPITIKANAFAPRSPPNDIRLSPLHAIQRSKGVWDIPIKAMRRYSNVIQDESGSSVTYYHIETPNFFKDNLVVEGATVESFAGQIAKKHNLKPTDIYKWSSTLQGYTRSNPCITKSK